MIITEENETYYLQALRVDFLTERCEREWYALALMRADAWGRKIDEQNRKDYSMRTLVERYNYE